MSIPQNRLSTEPDVSPYIPPDDVDHGLNEDWERGPVALNDSSEGMAYQDWHLTYDPSTPPGYNPDMMQYDGVTGYYDNSFTTSGNKVTGTARFKRASFTGGSSEFVFRTDGPNSRIRMALTLLPSDHANVDLRDKIQLFVQDGAAVLLCRVISINTVMDDSLHVVFASYDGDNGTATFYIDSVDADDIANPSRTLTTGVLDSGALSHMGVGGEWQGAQLIGGQVGYVGYKDAYLTNWSDFMTGSEPLQLDETTWTEWGGQPAFWNEDGEMTASLGTAGNMTKNGTIFKVNVGNYQYFALTPDDTGIPITVLSGVNSVQCTFCFDQNGQPTIAWIDGSDGGHIWWLDIQTGQPEIFDFQNPVTSVGLCLDDKRPRQVSVNDMLLWYTIPAAGPDHYSLHHRLQRDRFLTDYPMADPVWPYIHKLGMNSELRVQITTSTQPPV